MPNGNPLDGFFYPTLTLMIDSYSLVGFELCSTSSGSSLFANVPIYGFLVSKGFKCPQQVVDRRKVERVILRTSITSFDSIKLLLSQNGITVRPV